MTKFNTKKEVDDLNIIFYFHDKFIYYYLFISTYLISLPLKKNIHFFMQSWVESTKEFELKKNILIKNPGKYYCFWKPLIIKEIFTASRVNTSIIYIDNDDLINNNFLQEVKKSLDTKKIVAIRGSGKLQQYCKRSVLIKLNADLPVYWNLDNLEAGIIGIKVHKESAKFLNTWLMHSLEEDIITDKVISNISNYSNFIKHGIDQTLLTILLQKYEKIVQVNNVMRKNYEANSTFFPINVVNLILNIKSKRKILFAIIKYKIYLKLGKHVG